MTDVIEPGGARALARALVRVDSRNPSLVKGGPGELACVQLLQGVLHAWGFWTEIQDAAVGRPNLLAHRRLSPICWVG